MSDLLGAFGQAWLRLLLYPGGLSAVLAALVLARLRGIRQLEPLTAPRLLDLLPPLSAIALLPLAPAASFPYGLDLPTAVTLLLWPELRRAAAERRDPHQLAAHYLPTFLAAIALASAAGTFDLSGLLRWPSTPVRQAALLLGAGAWIAAIPRLAPPQPHLAAACSALGLMLIGVLPLSAAINTIAAAAPAWLGVAAAITIALAGMAAARRLPVQWGYVWASAALVAASGVLLDSR
ncbi:hypothetical protein A6A03_11495 [Chloroflexus islandicus]|uniref:Uncharacterized protein n=1 Tax=Chloroflexus islandicus TaxID=1707952 RepID=A0A178MG44_9CHLR|nr:hypothetical protein [Chloroflexus islandicus]OAN46924.1 hypothetical protein A6A03_11495 [Chloroflexus islandicus]